MTTNYDTISEKYQRAKLQPWRAHIERYTLLRMVGNIRGQTVVDLACGEGYYTRLLSKLGAARVVGVDLSRGMIDLAEAEDAREPLGIEYRVCDARSVDMAGVCDLVFAGYLLNYARNAGELHEMCRAIVRSLKPGGRFVAVNNNPADPPDNFETGRQYGYSKRLEGGLVEGAPIYWYFHLPEGSFEITNYYLSTETMENVMRQTGMRDIRWHEPQVSPEGIAEFGREHWLPFLRFPPIAFVDCSK